MRFLKIFLPALIFVFAISAALSPISVAQSADAKVLTNKDVLEMLKSGLPADIVAAKIRASHCNFETEVSDLKSLKDAGVPDNVVLAMVQAPHYAVVPSDGKIRVFVTDSQSWEIRGGWAPQTAQVAGQRRVEQDLKPQR